MAPLLRLAATLLAELGTGESRRRAVRRMALAGLCGALALLSLAAALGCAVAALWIYALPHVGEAAAPLLAAAALLVLGLLLLLGCRQAMKHARDPDTGALAAELVLAEVTKLVGEHPATALLAALVGGLLAGSRDGPAGRS